jgi:hypothetical protein
VLVAVEAVLKLQQVVVVQGLPLLVVELLVVTQKK